jgi:hypothetical protein
VVDGASVHRTLFLEKNQQIPRKKQGQNDLIDVLVIDLVILFFLLYPHDEGA